MDVQNPHDRFFKEVFSVRENALDFINGAFLLSMKHLKDTQNGIV